MSLQSRLFAIIIAIVVLPLLAASLLGRGIINRELERRAYGQIAQGARTATIVYEVQLRNARDRAELVANDEEFQSHLLSKDYAALQRFLDRRLAESQDRIDFLVVADSAGKPLAAALSPAEFLPAFSPLTQESIAAPGDPSARGALTAPIPINSPEGAQTLAVLSTGYYLDNAFARVLVAGTEVDATILIGGTAVSSTVRSASQAEGPVKISIPEKQTQIKSSIEGEKVFASPVQLRPDLPVSEFALLVSAPQGPVLSVTSAMTTSMIIVLLLAILAAASLGYILARGITRPVRELVAGANAVAGGNYDQHIQVRSRDEVGQLATAFNEMAMRLSEHIDELKESREKLKRALTRFGQTLRATHDLDQLLNEVVETSIDHLQARSGVVMLVDHGARELRVSVSRGTSLDGLRLKLGEGLAGYVAESGNPLRLPDGGSSSSAAAQEPRFRTAMLVPIFAQERVTGVLGLYDKEGGLDFSEGDLATLLSLADQAGVAIENVILHDQAQRLSITDGLTGTWNHRYFKMQIERELERSARFRRPFSLLMLDIDDFKVVNDNYGHQRGNAVLVELVSRIRFTIREIDVLARWGGEEFVVILPETDASGGVLTAEKIRSVVAEKPFEGSPDLKITVTVGVACYWQHGSDEESLVQAADTALLDGKAEGKNRVVLFSSSKRDGRNPGRL